MYSSLFHLLFLPHPPAPTAPYTLSLHDALPISPAPSIRPPPCARSGRNHGGPPWLRPERAQGRSEEHTSELQSRFDLVCRLLLEKKKKKKSTIRTPVVINFQKLTPLRVSLQLQR